MSLYNCKIGPFASFYVGNANDSDPLVLIDLINTEDNEVNDGFQDTYFVGINKQLQTGTRTVVVNLTFYGDDLLLWNITKGIDIMNTNRNSPPENTFYSLLIIDPEEDSQTSIYIPSCRTNRVLSYRRSKKAPTQANVIFTAEAQSRYDDIVFYGTVDELIVEMGAKSPF